jgi:hypothetical protein
MRAKLPPKCDIFNALGQNGQVDEPPRRTITRRSDEPKLEIGEIIPIKEGVIGIVHARYVPSNKADEVHYIVELRPDKAAGETH